VRFDRAHFASYGDSSLDVELVYYVLSADYNEFMDRQQAILLETYRRFERGGIEFAFPTRTIYLKRGDVTGAGQART
jgi:small-conductance mechanosensitive channel